jgi:hypothetical protein
MMRATAAAHRLLAISVALTSCLLPGQQQKKISAIDFFGHQGLDAPAVRRALPFTEGDPMPPSADYQAWKATIRKIVKEVTGSESTDQTFVCCNEQGDWAIYIGLRGASTMERRLKPEPIGAIRLAAEVVRFDAELEQVWKTAVQSGDQAAIPAKLQAMRPLAAKHERSLLDVVANSGDRAHRAAAAFAIGHAMEPSVARLSALLSASDDSDSTVRNNAVRGLAEWASRHAAWRSKIPPGVFINLVRSGTWSDRNKGSSLLAALTESREEKMLAEIRAVAREAEIALWRWRGHAYFARMILGRAAGIEEQRLKKLVEAGDVKTILEALR